MDSSPKNLVDRVITQARQHLSEVQIQRYDVDQARALVKLEGKWHRYRIIITRIHRIDKTAQYAYHILDEHNQHVHRFDNSADKTAIRMRYVSNWKTNQHQEVPHQHDVFGNITLTEPMTFEKFARWFVQNLDTSPR